MNLKVDGSSSRNYDRLNLEKFKANKIGGSKWREIGLHHFVIYG